VNPPALSVLIPAAGASKRLGQAKQLVKYKGKSLLQNAIDVACSVKPLQIIVVTGAHAPAVRASTQTQSVHWVHNPHWETGMGGSIALGAKAVDPESNGLMIFLCDQYRVDANDVRKLVNAWISNPGRIVVAEAKTRLMPPVIFPPACLDSLQHLQGDQGARSVLETHQELIVPVPISNAAVDLDTPDQLKSLLLEPRLAAIALSVGAASRGDFLNIVQNRHKPLLRIPAPAAYRSS
jgi:molybdenum cofactor cytidylyltransferase